ncbi:MAG: hypothetical protein QM811_23880 [Pirellulales bacterium]
MLRRHTLLSWVLIGLVCASTVRSTADEPRPFAIDTKLFAPENRVAWCIVPFDAKKRGPEDRAEMLARLGFTKFAYDYRAEHVPTFDAEVAALKKRKIALAAWWFPTTLNAEARTILDVIERNDVHPQLWVTGGGAATKTPDEQAARRGRSGADPAHRRGGRQAGLQCRPVQPRRLVRRAGKSRSRSSRSWA